MSIHLSEAATGGGVGVGGGGGGGGGGVGVGGSITTMVGVAVG